MRLAVAVSSIENDIVEHESEKRAAYLRTSVANLVTEAGRGPFRPDDICRIALSNAECYSARKPSAGLVPINRGTFGGMAKAGLSACYQIMAVTSGMHR